MTNEERIDLIKWGCEYAEGFSLTTCIGGKDGAYCPDGFKQILPQIARQREDLYPLFLQRCIEGINRTDGISYAFIQFPGTIEIIERTEHMDPVASYANFNGTLDEAKEAALMWVKSNQS